MDEYLTAFLLSGWILCIGSDRAAFLFGSVVRVGDNQISWTSAQQRLCFHSCNNDRSVSLGLWIFNW